MFNKGVGAPFYRGGSLGVSSRDWRVVGVDQGGLEKRNAGFRVQKTKQLLNFCRGPYATVLDRSVRPMAGRDRIVRSQTVCYGLVPFWTITQGF
jgi:hypothetical protein